MAENESNRATFIKVDKMAELTAKGVLNWHQASLRLMEDCQVPQNGGATRTAEFSGGYFFLTLGDKDRGFKVQKDWGKPPAGQDQLIKARRPQGYAEQFCRLEYHRKGKKVVIHEDTSAQMEALLSAAGFPNPMLFEVDTWINELLENQGKPTS